MLIVGLGNPGTEYADTFHNMGYMVLDAISAKLGKKVNKIECSSLTCVFSVKGEKVILAKPTTYMNLSGQAVKSLMTKYEQTLDDLVVIYDDLDIPRFSVRARENGSAGTHNGMRNVVELVGSEDFRRIRMGIGRDEGELKDYVLNKIGAEDKKTFGKVADDVADLVIEYISTRDFNKLMREGNVVR